MLSRADKDHWWTVVLVILLADLVPVYLVLKTDPAIAGVGTLLIAIALFFVARRLTVSRKWWVPPLLGSPFVLGPLVVGIGFILAVMGIIPVP